MKVHSRNIFLFSYFFRILALENIAKILTIGPRLVYTLHHSGVCDQLLLQVLLNQLQKCFQNETFS